MGIVEEVCALPAVSVIILNWNGKPLLDECLVSLAAQTFSDFEVILVDNGSADGSADFVANNYPKVNLIRLESNHGFCGGNNVGFKAARGRFIALLNNDTAVTPGWLEALYSAMIANPEAGACDSRVYFFDPKDTVWCAGGDYTIAGSVFNRGYMVRDSPERGLAETEVFIACACAVLYRRTALERVGLFDEQFFSGYEDVDLSFRLHATGYRVLNIPSAVVYHKVSATSRTNSEFYVFHSQKNVLLTFVKNMPPKLLLKYLPLHVIYTIGSLLYFARLGRLGAAVRGKLSVIRRWPELMAKRQSVQRLRSVPVEDIEKHLSRGWLGPKLSKLLG